jgi:hypothetical protein
VDKFGGGIGRTWGLLAGDVGDPAKGLRENSGRNFFNVLWRLGGGTGRIWGLLAGVGDLKLLWRLWLVDGLLDGNRECLKRYQV